MSVLNNFIFLLFSFNCVIVQGEDSLSFLVPDNARLFNHLMKDYNKEIDPRYSNDDNIKVKFSITPKCLEIGHDAIIRGKVEYVMEWTDKRLKFNPEDFNGIMHLSISPKLLWLPDIALYNKHHPFPGPLFPFMKEGFAPNAVVSHDGSVVFLPDMHVEAFCRKNGLNEDQPWGEKHCFLKFGSWTYDGDILDLQIKGHENLNISTWEDTCPMKVINAVQKRETKLYKCCDEPYVHLKFNFTLQRRFAISDKGLVKNPLFET